MMRIKKICLTIILICFGMLFFVACKEERFVKSISLNEYSTETPLECAMGKFSYNDYTVLITYENGETEELSLTEDMISETDKLKFYQEGRNRITLSYKGAETSVEINVSRNQFPENIQFNGFTETYNGTTFTIEVEGDIPGATKIVYPQGNTFKDAGVYKDITAILQCDGYATKILSTTVEIKKATYDVTNAQLYEETVVYDRDAHSLAVKGTPVKDEKGNVLYYNPVSLPQGVSVSYSIITLKDGKGNNINSLQSSSGNKAVDAGTYEVRAHFKGDEINYERIPDSVKTLTIKRADYDLPKIEFLDKMVVYSGEEHALSISSESKMPDGVIVDYTITKVKNGAGEDIDKEYQKTEKKNTAKDAGSYLVNVKFSINGKSAENYKINPDQEEKTASLTILRASYDAEMKNVYLDTKWEEFVENETYEIYLECDLPEGVKPQFTLTNASGEVIALKGGETEDKTGYKYQYTVQTEGEYVCVVTFKHENENYMDIKLELKAWIYISSVI